MRYQVLILIILVAGPIIGQKPFYYLSKGDTVKLDTTSLKDVQVFGLSKNEVNLGNEGSPSYALKINRDYFLKGDYSALSAPKTIDDRSYSVFKPVTNASYVTGSKLEQHFNILHTQNFNKQSNFSIGFNKINSPGYYLNQATNSSELRANAYGSEIGKLKYNFDLNIAYNNQLSALNGGIVNDSDFVNDVNDLRNRQLLDVNLANASQQLKMWHIQYDHGLNLSGKLDSINGNIRTIRLENSLVYHLQSRNYYDSILNTSFYNYVLDDSLITNDDVKYDRFATDLGVSFTSKSIGFLKLFAGLNPSLNRYTQSQLDTAVFDLDAKVSGQWNYRNWDVEASAVYLLNDAYSNNDFNVDANLIYKLTEKSKVKFTAFLQRDRVALDYQTYRSNNVIWNNTFEKQTLYNYTLKYEHKSKWNKAIGINYFDFLNPIYFGYNARPDQALGFAQIIQLEAKAQGYLGKHWFVNASTTIQEKGGYDVFLVPNFIFNLGVDYGFKMFKNKLDLSLGMNLNYFSRYETKDFDPISGQFYIGSQQEVGAYPYADIFLKGRVQRATFFVMSTHPHQGLLGYDYFLLQHYPAQDRIIRVGVSWLFLN